MLDRRQFLASTYGAAFFAERRIVSRDPLEAETDLARDVNRYTPVDDFFVRNHLDEPDEMANATLRIEGELERPGTIDAGMLGNLPRVSVGAVLECAGNRVETNALASNGLWEGWSVRDVLRPSGVKPSASWLWLYGRDGFVRSVPMTRAFACGLLATHLNGSALPQDHGKPWRAVFPGWYGMDSVKWLERIVAASHPLNATDPSYRTARISSSGQLVREDLPAIQPKSVITYPAKGQMLAIGSSVIRGLAWAGATDVAAVEVSGNGGEDWTNAQVGPRHQREWVRWEATLSFRQPGVAEVVCRAVGEDGTVQPARRDAGRRDGYANNWWHRVHCVVR